jgi:hypothetical protein
MVLTTVLVVGTTGERKYPPGWEHSDPPPGDEFLTNRFGRTWSEPIYASYLLVGDHYVDAPYVVEQRGFVILVNGERVEDGIDIRCVLPLPPPPAVTNDPGMPPGITKQTWGGTAISHPVYNAKRRYFDYLRLKGEDRVKAELDYMRQLPCISNIVPRAMEGPLTNRFLVYDYSGLCFGTTLPIAAAGPPPTYEDTNSAARILQTYQFMSGLLAGHNFVHIRNGGLIGHESAILYSNRWLEAFAVMSNPNLSPAERLSTIQAKGYFREYSLESIRGDHPFDGFIPTPQLWQRLSGDMSWTNDAPARLLALTNGWQRIPPAFMRTQMVAVATVPGASTRDADGTGAVGRVTTRIGPSAGLDSAAPGSGQTGSHSRPANGKLLLVLALVGTLAGAFFVARRSIRK